MMTAHNREIQETAGNDYASWWHCFVAAFFVASLGVAADAAADTYTLAQIFNDPTATPIDRFGTSVAVYGNNVLIGAIGDDAVGNDVGQAHVLTTVPEPSPLTLTLAGLAVFTWGRGDENPPVID